MARALVLALGIAPALGFAPPASRWAPATARAGTAAEDMGLPCTDDCAIGEYPKLPPSVHPGVLTGQAMMDLLDTAHDQGFAIPAVNCVTSSSINACLEAARKNDAPIMIQFSSGGSQFYAGKGACERSAPLRSAARSCARVATFAHARPPRSR